MEFSLEVNYLLSYYLLIIYYFRSFFSTIYNYKNFKEWYNFILAKVRNRESKNRESYFSEKKRSYESLIMFKRFF